MLDRLLAIPVPLEALHDFAIRRRPPDDLTQEDHYSFVNHLSPSGDSFDRELREESIFKPLALAAKLIQVSGEFSGNGQWEAEQFVPIRNNLNQGIIVDMPVRGTE